MTVFDHDCMFFFKQKTAYEMRISDWSSDVCSSDLAAPVEGVALPTPASTPEPSTDSEPDATSLAPTTDEIRDDEAERALEDRKRVVKGKSVSVRVEHGGRLIIKKKSTRRLSS